MAVRLQPGEMDQVVSLFEPTTVRDAFGQHTEYVLRAKVTARVRPLRGREYFAAGQLQSPATMEISIYWRIDVRAWWRVEWMGRMYDVTGEPADVDARHDALELLCAAVTA